MEIPEFNWEGFKAGVVAFNPEFITSAENFLAECQKHGVAFPEPNGKHPVYSSLKYAWFKHCSNTLYYVKNGVLTTTSILEPNLKFEEIQIA